MDHLPTAPALRYRNLRGLIDKTTDHLDYAYAKGVMSLYGRSKERRTIVLPDGREILDFARGSYLGLDNHPLLVEEAISALQEYGSLQWSGARTRLNFARMADLEYDLSDLFEARALVFSLVLTANMGALPLLACGAFTADERPVVVFDRFAHASLAYHKAVVADETEVVTINHNDLDQLENLCRRHSSVAYVADGIYSMGGKAPIAELRMLQEKYGLFLYIDDAHGISIRGNRGEGYARSQFGSELGERTIIAASLSKGFGATGGVLMLGTATQELLLRRYAVPHAFSMGPTLPDIAAAQASARIHRTQELRDRQSRLAEVIACFDRLRPSSGSGDGTPIRMVPVGDERAAIDAAARLIERGFYAAAAIFPAVPQGQGALRLCLTADHNVDELRGLCEVLDELTATVAVGAGPQRSR